MPPPVGGTAAPAVLARLQLLITRRLDGLLQGEYLGLLPGPGSEAGESRAYHPGDDVRRMDWPVTARTTVPHVRLTEADRELETWLAVDLSASLEFGTAQCLKRDLALAAAAAVTHLTVRGGNRVGAVVARGSGPPRRLPARPGRRSAQGLLRTIASPDTPPGEVDLAALIDSLHRPPRRRGLAVVISDFLAPAEQWRRPLRKLAARHDVLAIEVLDPRELSLPDVGVLELLDPESGATVEVQTADPRLRERYAAAAAAQRGEIEAALRRAGAAHLRLRTDSDWLADIVRFVAARRHARSSGAARGAGLDREVT
ncbi:DUF58 domain-containing protein [Natronosporangium hydrolyticum]|uniref:DUF58 domain-containing protein n=1 Tax=Natronosporangium hydrolyticum TaxID=2811111 RepID=A0A895YIH8_9ACTN|nr:DUF58 domain-containing protein [Natronosporangium hydrolyticum]QSB17361.1 DUF58 domain-containing protein [Natronosporangium hydrolyticum]